MSYINDYKMRKKSQYNLEVVEVLVKFGSSGLCALHTS